MPHINAYIRKEQYPIYLDLKLTGLWATFLSDCLEAYDKEFRQPAYDKLEEKDQKDDRELRGDSEEPDTRLRQLI